jgi:hypothetical protein
MAFLYGLTPSMLSQIQKYGLPNPEESVGRSIEDYPGIAMSQPGGTITFEPDIVAGAANQTAPVMAYSPSQPMAPAVASVPQLPIDAAAIATKPQLSMLASEPTVDFGLVTQPPAPVEPLPTTRAFEPTVETQRKQRREDFEFERPVPAVPAAFAASSVLAPYLAMYAQQLEEEGTGTEGKAPEATPEVTPEAPAVPATGIPTEPPAEVPPIVPEAAPATEAVPTQEVTAEAQPPAAAPAAPVAPPEQPKTGIPINGQIGTGGASSFNMLVPVGGGQKEYEFKFEPAKGRSRARVQYRVPGTEKYFTIEEPAPGKKFVNEKAGQLFASAASAHQSIAKQGSIFRPAAETESKQLPQIKMGDNWVDLNVDPNTGQTFVVDEMGGVEPIDLTTIPGYEKDLALQRTIKEARTAARLSQLQNAFGAENAKTYTYDPVTVYAERDVKDTEKPQELTSLARIAESEWLHPHPMDYVANIKDATLYVDAEGKTLPIPVFDVEFAEPLPGTAPVPEDVQAMIKQRVAANNQLVVDTLRSMSKSLSPERKSMVDETVKQIEGNLAILNDDLKAKELEVEKYKADKKSPEYVQAKRDYNAVKKSINELEAEERKLLANPLAISMPGAGGTTTTVITAPPGSSTNTNIVYSWPQVSAALLPPLSADTNLQTPQAQQGEVFTPQDWFSKVIVGNTLSEVATDRVQSRSAIYGEVDPRLAPALETAQQAISGIVERANSVLGNEAYKALEMPINGNRKHTLNNVLEKMADVSRQYDRVSEAGNLNYNIANKINDDYREATAPLRSERLTLTGMHNGQPVSIEVDNKDFNLPEQLIVTKSDPMNPFSSVVMSDQYYSAISQDKAPEAATTRPLSGDKEPPPRWPVQIMLGNPTSTVKVPAGSSASLTALASTVSGGDPLETTKLLIDYAYNGPASSRELIQGTWLTYNREDAFKKASKQAIEETKAVNKILSSLTDEGKNLRREYFSMVGAMNGSDGLQIFNDAQNFANWSEVLVSDLKTDPAARKQAFMAYIDGQLKKWEKTPAYSEILNTVKNRDNKSDPQVAAIMDDYKKQTRQAFSDYADALQSIRNGLSDDDFASFKVKRKGTNPKNMSWWSQPQAVANTVDVNAPRTPSSLLQLPVLNNAQKADPIQGTKLDKDGRVASSTDYVANRGVIAALASANVGDNFAAALAAAPSMQQYIKKRGDIQRGVLSDLTPYRSGLADTKADTNVYYRPGSTEVDGFKAFWRFQGIGNSTGFGDGQLQGRRINY